MKEIRMASCRVEYMTVNVSSWSGQGTYGYEKSAIISAKPALKRSNVQTVRVSDSNGSIVWINSK